MLQYDMRLPTKRAGIFCFATALALAQPPVHVAARVELQEGIARLALRNTRDTAVTVALRVVAVEGAELPVTSFGATVPSRGVWARTFPVRRVTTDQPVLHCMLVYDSTNLTRLRVPCKSGALFRQASVAVASKVTLRHAAVSTHATAEGAREVRVGGKTILTDLGACFGREPARPWISSNDCLYTELVRGTSVAARAVLMHKGNSRGDAVLSLTVELGASGFTTHDIPSIVLRLPAALLSNSLVVTRVAGDYHFFPTEELSKVPTSPLLTGPAVDEWSLVTARDWLVFSLDASYVEAETWSDGVLLRFTSRTPWRPPFVPGRFHATLLRMHLPVGILP